MSVTRVGRLIVVRDAARKPSFYCRVPGCDAVFYDDELRAYERHVAACSDQHADELRGESLRERAPDFFDPVNGGDVELRRWARENATAIIEGRLRM